MFSFYTLLLAGLPSHNTELPRVTAVCKCVNIRHTNSYPSFSVLLQNLDYCV